MILLFGFNPVFAAGETGDEDKWDVNNPPGDSRSISIDTRSGTWMSLDVSPDGNTIAFDLLGDIYLLPMAGGEARAINSGLAWSMQPQFSPDGSEIAFISDAGGGDNIWIMQADGSDAKQLTEEDFRLLNNPWWSPDGQYIAARKHFTTTRSLGTGEIWLYHRDGGSGIPVVEKPSEKHQKEQGEPAFSPDGRHLATTGDVDGAAKVWDVLTGSVRAEFLHQAGGALGPMAVIPDGTTLVTTGYDVKAWRMPQ